MASPPPSRSTGFGKIQVFVYLFALPSLYSPLQLQNLRNDKFFSSLLINTKFGLLVRILYLEFPEKFLRISFSRTYSGFRIFYLSAWPNFCLLLKSQRITFSGLSCLQLFSFCASLLHSHIIWLTLSYELFNLSSHYLHFLFFCSAIKEKCFASPLLLFYLLLKNLR